MKKIMIVLICLGSMYAVTADQTFVVTKKKKASTASLKEEIGNQYGNLIKESSKITQNLARVNHQIVHLTEDLVDGECTSERAVLHPYAQQLDAYRKKLEQFEEETRIMLTSLEHGLPHAKKNESKKEKDATLS